MEQYNTNPNQGISNTNPKPISTSNTPNQASTSSSNSSITSNSAISTSATKLETNTISDTNLYSCSITCCIRRKPGLVGIPGQDPAERVYKIGASLDPRTRGNLKGISGDLELKFMPEVIGVSPNDPTFRRSVEEYWASIGRPVPPDESYLKAHEQGIKFEIRFNVVGAARKERMNRLERVKDKMELLDKFLLEKSDNGFSAQLQSDSVSDYLLLNYALKYSKVANSYEDINKSPKIEFYIFEKAVSITNHLSLIDLRAKAMTLYKDLEGNSRKIDAVLLMFNEDLNKFETQVDKLLRIDELYNTAPIENMKTFVKFAEDKTWETKYLIKSAIADNKLRTLANSTAIYYEDILIGSTLEDAVLFLNTDLKGISIKENLNKTTK